MNVMKNLLVLMFMLLGVTAFSQSSKYVIIKKYKDGKLISQTAIAKPKPDTVVVYKPTFVEVVKEIPVEVEKVVTKEVEVEKVVEKVVEKEVPVEVVKEIEVPVEKVVVKEVEAPKTYKLYAGPHVMYSVHRTGTMLNLMGAGGSLLFKNKVDDIFHIGGGFLNNTRTSASDKLPTPYIMGGWYIKVGER